MMDPLQILTTNQDYFNGIYRSERESKKTKIESKKIPRAVIKF